MLKNKDSEIKSGKMFTNEMWSEKYLKYVISES